MSLNSSHARWLMVPVPNEAVLILPGLAFACAMNSATVAAGTDGFTSMTNGKSTRGNRRDVAQDVEGQRGIERRVDCVGGGDEQQRVAVGRRIDRGLRREIGAAPG